MEGFKRIQFTLKTNNSFFRTDEAVLYILLTIAGLAISVPGYRMLDQHPYNSGKELIGVFIPAIFTAAYFTYTGLRYFLSNGVFVKGIVLFVVLTAPYAPLFFETFSPTPHDDFGRYYEYAKNMLNNNTLWGGDQLAYKDVGSHYVTQPGYRYFVYLELVLFGDLLRFVQFLNLLLFVITLFFFQRTILQVIPEKNLRLALITLTLLVSPYFLKNLLMGLPEWFAALMLIWSCILYLNTENRIAAVFMLGLVPFFRQNLLIAVLILFAWILIRNKSRLSKLMAFILPLLLPLYHNLYYAHEWRFFVEIFRIPFLTYNEQVNPTGIDMTFISRNLIHLTGFDYVDARFKLVPIALIFVPFSTALFVWSINVIKFKSPKLFFAAVVLSAIVPPLLLGSEYYPRFEFTNTIVMITAFIFLMDYEPAV